MTTTPGFRFIKMVREDKYLKLREKLLIAVEALEYYADESHWYTTEYGEKCDFGSDGYEIAQEALGKIINLEEEDECSED